ncbi:MAG: hypothetical protein HDT28_08695 [Clostridiales bacterium]|nr:hypothetical protein [Clostridiales bacterium]
MNKAKSFFIKSGAWLKKFFIGVWKDKTKFILALAICLLLIGSLFAFAVNTDWGRVSVKSFKLKTGDDTWVVADVYKPKNASADNRVPCVIVCPGYQRTKETQAAYNLELSRRGFAVVCLDPYSQGESSTTDQTASEVGYGLFAIIEHVTEVDESGAPVNFDYIDLSRVGIAGHSAGGNACIYAMSKYGTHNNQRIQAAYISGYVRNSVFTDSDMKTLKNLACNLGVAYARFDEGAYQNSGTSTVVDADAATSLDYSDMRYTKSAINIVNSGIYLHEGTEENFVTEVSIDDYYGSPDDHTFRVVHNERTIHALQPYDNLSIAHVVEFFDYVFTDGAIEASGVSPYSQVWWVKEIFQGFMLIGVFLFVLAFPTLLLRTKFFKTAVHEVQPMGHNDGKVDKLIFWGIFTVCAVFALFAYKWAATFAAGWFTTGPSENKGGLTWLFPQRMTNAVMLWAVMNAAVGMGLFLLAHFLRHRKRGATLINLKDKPSNVFKNLLLAFITFVSFYAIVDVLYLIFHVDPRFFFVCVRPLFLNTNWKILVLALMYMPLFFLFYFTNSVRVNCSMRNARWGKVGSVAIACVANCIGLIGIIGLQYIVFSATGTVWLTDTWLYVNLLWGVVPMMILLPIYNRYFYNKTGKVYLGAFVTCMIFIMISMLNTVTYLPL